LKNFLFILPTSKIIFAVKNKAPQLTRRFV